MKADFRIGRRGDFDAIAELVQRTTRFNTTTIRHSKPGLEELLASEAYRTHETSLSETFGQLGLVAVAITERPTGHR